MPVCVVLCSIPGASAICIRASCVQSCALFCLFSLSTDLRRAASSFPHPIALAGSISQGPDSQGRLWIMMDYCAVGSVVSLLKQKLTEPEIAAIMNATLMVS